MADTSITQVTGLKKNLALFRIKVRITCLALREYRSLKKTIIAMRNLRIMKKNFAGQHKFCKVVRASGSYYWQMHFPGYPSKAFDNHFLGAINRIIPVRSFHNKLTILFMGITSKCPLNCKHCYAWSEKNDHSDLPVSDLKKIISEFQVRGVSHLQFGGGEPMTRYEVVLELLNSINPVTETWIATCGFGIDHERAKRLRQAGLTGASISVDHYDREKHNEFRGNGSAFDWALTATRSSSVAGLLTCWSICVTDEMANNLNLMKYASLASSFNVNFIQVLEPMPSGRYEDKDVRLSGQSILSLEEFYLRMNTDKSYRNLPIVVYPNYHQRRMGCLASGNRYLYIDSVGRLHPCPFCRSSEDISVLTNDLDRQLKKVREETCLLGH